MRKTKLIPSGAVVKRINRLLASQNLMLRTTRGDQMQNDYGSYYIHDLDRDTIHTHHVDIEHYARNNGLLLAHEKVEWS